MIVLNDLISFYALLNWTKSSLILFSCYFEGISKSICFSWRVKMDAEKATVALKEVKAWWTKQ